MSKSYQGMRKGISLVEMMIAVILFAVLATIGLKYSKNFLDTSLSAKKARIAAAMDQASQLAAAYKLYTTQFGDPAVIGDLADPTKGIMTALPPAITEVYTSAWDLNVSTGITGSGHGLTVLIDGNSTAKEAAQYCAIWNKEFNASVELNVSGTEDFGATLDAPTQVSTTATGWCWGTSAIGYSLFVKLP